MMDRILSKVQDKEEYWKKIGILEYLVSRITSLEKKTNKIEMLEQKYGNIDLLIDMLEEKLKLLET